MTTPIRVAILVPEYRPAAAARGGVDSVVDFALRVLSDRAKWDLRVISLRMSRKATESRRLLAPTTWLRGPVVTTATHQGVPLYQVGAALAELEPTRYWPRRAVRSLLKGVDVVLAIGGSPALVKSVRSLGLPVVTQFATFLAGERENWIRSTGGISRAFRVLMTRFVSRYDRQGVLASRILLVMNRHVLLTSRDLGALDVRLAPPGVDTDWFTPPPPGDRSGLLMVGRLSDPRKNVALLVSAYNDLRTRYGFNSPLVLAGSAGPDAGVLEMIDRLDLADCVKVHVGVSDDQLRTLYRQAELFVLSSSEEGLGLVILEALATGLPVIATATEGAKEILDGREWANLIPLGEATPQRFADVIASRLSNAGQMELDAKSGRTYVVDRFSDASTAATLSKALRDAALAP